MSERILRALMQLFAIIAQVDENSDSSEEQSEIKSSRGMQIIESFLRTELNARLVQQYINLFNEHLNALHLKQQRKDGEKKRTSLNSVKILRICSQINEELAQKQKVIVLIRIIEFIQSNDNVSEQEVEFVNTVAESFNISKDEYDVITDFILGSVQFLVKSQDVLYVCPRSCSHEVKHLKLEGLDEEIRILQVKSVSTLFFRYFGKDELSLNGQFVPNDRTHIFTNGSTLRTQKSKHLYYSDVIRQFLHSDTRNKLTFKARDISFKFRGGKKGLHPISITEESGNLVGIMGGSGTGKSTLLNVLNGTFKPSSGEVTINGINIHKENDKIQGIIGFVSQDDLLIEELSVFQNLYFSAKLCFSDLSERELNRKVIDILYSIGLYEVKDLVVGNPLEKTISGGQRKRLNIALELIREPEVLFVDEPTSGLSSRDSENIMDLLKEMTFKGKLVFVVIHQPSSDIFKLFDRLLVIDQGGYLIFDGNPIDSIVYFKHHIHHVNAEERECSVCGNVNPEQLFNIIETKIVDEYGNLTNQRKTTPEEWANKFEEFKIASPIEDRTEKPQANSGKANRPKQFNVFFLRDFLSKLSNRQYVLITLFEAPALALVLAFFVKYFNGDSDANGMHPYSFYKNENLPQFIFIAIVVSLFLGLTISAEEIFKDRKILRRESFLHLSRGSYLLSKISIMFIISAIQSMLFVLIGNYVLEIKGLWIEYWLILFSTSCAANVMGLNISSAFNSAKVIYIIVPILIIPQLLFSGVIVKFDKLHPVFSRTTEVPWIGNVMVSRWAYEAIAVVQSTENELEKEFFEINNRKFNAAWKKDFWIPEMQKQLETLTSTHVNNETFDAAKELMIKEITKEESNWENFTCVDCIQKIKSSSAQRPLDQSYEISYFLETLKKQFIKTVNDQNSAIESLKQKIGLEQYQKLKEIYTNEALNDIVTNKTEPNKLINYNNELFRKDNPIYQDTKNVSFFNAHFYAPSKHFLGLEINTFWANILVLWLFAIGSAIALYYDWLRKTMIIISYWRYRLTKKPSVK